jgi:hypothetical protein
MIQDNLKFESILISKQKFNVFNKFILFKFMNFYLKNDNSLKLQLEFQESRHPLGI